MDWHNRQGDVLISNGWGQSTSIPLLWPSRKRSTPFNDVEGERFKVGPQIVFREFLEGSVLASRPTDSYRRTITTGSRQGCQSSRIPKNPRTDVVIWFLDPKKGRDRPVDFQDLSIGEYGRTRGWRQTCRLKLREKVSIYVLGEVSRIRA